MKKLNAPTFFNDHDALDALSTNIYAGSHPHLQPYVAPMRAAYTQYVAAQGNVRNITAAPVPANIKAFLLGHYASPTADLGHITTLREESKAKTCSMCGSLHSGQLDHIMPKAPYPGFAIFGLNLVPACKCNNERTNAITGPNPGERILHPYFDNVLNERIFAAHFEDLGPVPRISIRLVLPAAHPEFAAANFHVENVVKRTSIIGYLIPQWSNLIRRPSLIAGDLRRNPASRGQLKDILEDKLERTDDARESKNNWDSVFLAGLLDPLVLDWLFGRFSMPGRVPGTPLCS